jgi:hypothetical protein
LPLGRPPRFPGGASLSNLKPLVIDEFYAAADRSELAASEACAH